MEDLSADISRVEGRGEGGRGSEEYLVSSVASSQNMTRIMVQCFAKLRSNIKNTKYLSQIWS